MTMRAAHAMTELIRMEPAADAPLLQFAEGSPLPLSTIQPGVDTISFIL